MNFDSDKPKDQQRVLIYLLLLFYIVYWICAIFLQSHTHHPVSKQGSALDILTGNILMTMSVIALLIATQRSSNNLKLLLWLGVSAVAGALAIDEWFEFHEKTRATTAGWFAFGDDDYVKIALWFCAGLGIFALYKLEELPNKVLIIFLLGFLFQSIYLVIDMGDGDFFQLPFSEIFLDWAEEIMELLTMQSYLASILMFHQQLYVNSKDG